MLNKLLPKILVVAIGLCLANPVLTAPVERKSIKSLQRDKQSSRLVKLSPVAASATLEMLSGVLVALIWANRPSKLVTRSNLRMLESAKWQNPLKNQALNKKQEIKLY